jgi:cobalt-zinc-cadmium resistance protein CzcA
MAHGCWGWRWCWQAGGVVLRQPADRCLPDISSTQVKIILKAPGMTPEEVESRVIAPVEQEMLGIPHQTVLRSVAKYAIADITINFDDAPMSIGRAIR